MRVRRLSWAGLEVSSGQSTLLIDPLVELGPQLKLIIVEGSPALVEPSVSGTASAVLLTHLHRDHADIDAAVRALPPGGKLLRPASDATNDFDATAVAEVEGKLAASDLGIQQVNPSWSGSIGPFELAAVTASDATGDPQVSWVIAAEGQRILHGGDTMWHGSWWKIAHRYGPFNAVFLPVNGAVINFPWTQPSADAPAAMTPAQAVDAARALQAKQLVPIHYGLFEHPDLYRVSPDAAGQTLSIGRDRGLEVAIVEPGENVSLA